MLNYRIFTICLCLFCGLSGSLNAAPGPTMIETIVLIRHGEKTSSEMGQLDDRGLNRSLALPAVLVGKYGRPNYIFAPNPSDQIGFFGRRYSYVRPLATIEPTAISLGMPVNTQFGYTQILKLKQELAKPMYDNAIVFIAWEHATGDFLAKRMMADYGHSSSMVPNWPNSDYDSIFVLRIFRAGNKTTAAFTHDHEGLDSKLSNSYPGQP